MTQWCIHNGMNKMQYLLGNVHTWPSLLDCSRVHSWSHSHQIRHLFGTPISRPELQRVALFLTLGSV
eukprot:6471719-Amphidinium_carterae.1